jgi:precorrin-6B methylase 1
MTASTKIRDRKKYDKAQKLHQKIIFQNDMKIAKMINEKRASEKKYRVIFNGDPTNYEEFETYEKAEKFCKNYANTKIDILDEKLR